MWSNKEVLRLRNTWKILSDSGSIHRLHSPITSDSLFLADILKKVCKCLLAICMINNRYRLVTRTTAKNNYSVNWFRWKVNGQKVAGQKVTGHKVTNLIGQKVTTKFFDNFLNIYMKKILKYFLFITYIHF